MNVAKISKLLFAAAGAALLIFVLCVIIRGSEEDQTTWIMFSVCMPVTGICFTGGIVLLIVDFIRKR